MPAATKAKPKVVSRSNARKPVSASGPAERIPPPAPKPAVAGREQLSVRDNKAMAYNDLLNAGFSAPQALAFIDATRSAIGGQSAPAAMYSELLGSGAFNNEEARALTDLVFAVAVVD